MKMVEIGPGLQLSELCFGSLVMGPLQRNLPPAEGAEVIKAALEGGVNFIDTAQVYRTYEHIRLAIKDQPQRVHLASKSNASSLEDMEQAVQEAMRSMEVDYIDIFHLHAARATPEVFWERQGALECLHRFKRRGIIGRVGIATHSVPVVKAAAEREDIDVVYPLINLTGIGILEGSREEMEEAIALAHRAGKFIYAMKVFGGGNLLDRRQEALDYVRTLAGIDLISIGMASPQEVEVNLGLMEGQVSPELMERTRSRGKMLKILGFCTGCGLCVPHCHSDALEVKDDKCKVDRDRCILCGYCAPHCPQFAIRVV